MLVQREFEKVGGRLLRQHRPTASINPRHGRMYIQMELASILTEPTLRRCWLLNKALENASLEDALRLACEAEAFLGTGQSSIPSSKNGHALKELPLNRPLTAPPVAGLLMTQPPRNWADGARASRSIEQGNGVELVPDQVVELAESVRGESLENAGATTHDPDEEVAHEASGRETEDEAANDVSEVLMTSDLSVLAGMEDIVRYLRQQDDVVVSAGASGYLVNGRFQLNCDELLLRANKIRHRQGKPQFQRIPSGFPTPNGGTVAEHVLDRH
jgi:hypothetical protein